MIGPAAAALAGFHDPGGDRFGVPTFPWRCAPDGMATLRQLHALGLRPGGQDVAGQVCRRRRDGVLAGYLYRVDAAKPRRTPTAAQLAALGKALRARQTCPACSRWVGYVPPAALGHVCWECSEAPVAAAAA